MLGTLLSRGAARGLGFAKLVSVGNEADVGVGELVELLAADPATKVITLFLETVRDAARLAAAARAAHAAGKPIVAYKLGRSALGEAAARSHTGALAGERRGARRLLPRLRHRARRHAGDAAGDCSAARGLQTVRISTQAGASHGGDHHRRRRGEVVDRLGLLGRASSRRRSWTSPWPAPRRRPTRRRSRKRCSRTATRCSRRWARPRSSIPSSRSSRSSPARDGASRSRSSTFLHAAGRSLARAGRASGHRGVPHARSLRRCARRLLILGIPPREAPRLAGAGEAAGRALSKLFAALGIPVAQWQVAEAPDFAHRIAYPVAVKRLGGAQDRRRAASCSASRIAEEFVRKAAALRTKERCSCRRMETGLAEAIVGYRDDRGGRAAGAGGRGRHARGDSTRRRGAPRAGERSGGARR